MAKTDFTSVDEYLTAQPAELRPTLERIRNIIRKALPGAKEIISYQLPSYTLEGAGTVIYFSGWKKHFSIYPATAGLVETFAAELAPYDVEKGTIRFGFTQPINATLIANLAKFRAREALAEAAAKPKRSAKKRSATRAPSKQAPKAPGAQSVAAKKRSAKKKRVVTKGRYWS